MNNGADFCLSIHYKQCKRGTKKTFKDTWLIWLKIYHQGEHDIVCPLEICADSYKMKETNEQHKRTSVWSGISGNLSYKKWWIPPLVIHSIRTASSLNFLNVMFEKPEYLKPCVDMVCVTKSFSLFSFSFRLYGCVCIQSIFQFSIYKNTLCWIRVDDSVRLYILKHWFSDGWTFSAIFVSIWQS